MYNEIWINLYSINGFEHTCTNHKKLDIWLLSKLYGKCKYFTVQ